MRSGSGKGWLASVSALLALVLVVSPALGQDRPRPAAPGRFTVSQEGIITDTQTGLEWYVGPDRDTSWDQAQAWAFSLKVAGGGWRLPTLKELQTLYNKALSPRKMDPVFQTTGLWIWSGELKNPSSAWGFDLLYGGHEHYASSRADSKEGRAFAVRCRR